MIKTVVVIFFIFTILACNPIQQASQTKSKAPQIPFTCLASQSSCEVSTELGIFTIEFSGQLDKGMIKTELPFQIKLSLDGLNKNVQIQGVSSYLEGKTMFMGKIPVFFDMTDKSSAAIVAQTLLASCSEEIMTWRIWFTVEVQQADNITEQSFFIDFDSHRL